MKSKPAMVVLVLLLLLAACGTAAPPTSAPRATALPTATPTAVGAGLGATAQPTRPSTGGPRPGGVLKVAINEDMPGWDPYRGGTVATGYSIRSYMHERLMDTKDTLPPCQITPYSPALASSWSWVDDTTLQFKLRQGVKYPNLPPVNGREFTAEDVVYSAKEQWPVMPLLAAPLSKMKGAEAVDRYTVNITLKEPYAPFLDRVPAEKRSVIVAPESYAGKKEITLPEENVGLGPFVITSSRPGVGMTMRKNENYFMPDRPYLDGLEISIIPDISTVMALLRSRKLDLYQKAGGIPIVDQMRKIPDLNSQVCPHTATMFIYMRLDLAPFNDIRVRRALSMAIDREAMLKTVYLGMGSWYYSSVTPVYPDLMLKKEDFPPETRRYFEYNPTEAKRLLAEAGLPGGSEISIMATNRTGEPLHAEASEFLAAAITGIGLRPSLTLTDSASFNRLVYAGGKDYKHLAIGYGTPGNTTDEFLYDNYHSQSTTRNRAHIKDPVLDKLIEQSWVTTDPTKLKEIIRQHQLRFAEQLYMVPLPQSINSVFWQANVKNVALSAAMNDNGPWLRHVWLEQ
ncbi:MAG: ABC transporter substrate-binding protein [Chloroflexi bacterium]|nr:ABC transporter substrate-binding protein [Chloroflexota bacterium]